MGCPASEEPLEYVVARNALEEIIITLREAADPSTYASGDLTSDVKGS